MNAMLPSKTSWFSRTLALALLLAPAAAQAQSLPKGYASDESPTSAPAAVATSTAAPAQAPAMKSTTGEDAAATGTATAQISTDASTDGYADTDPSALTDFQEPLQGYGSWVTDDTYGTVWVPDATVVGSDFAPYQTGGYWSLTDDSEWLWVSTYDWGYIPFHYGRWIWISGRGWSWIPGRTYAPSWVVWRTSDYGYIGWAPMPPAWYWYGGSAVYFTTRPSAAYVFCPTSYVFHSNVSNYVVHDKATVSNIASHSRNYTPANPTASGDHKSADSASASNSASRASTAPSASGAASAVRKPVGPSMKEAGIPDSAMPKQRASVDSRASLFSRKSTTSKAKALVKSTRLAAMSSAGNMPLTRGGSAIRSGSTPVVSSRSFGTSQAVSASRPMTSGPVIHPPSRTIGSTTWSSPSPVYRPQVSAPAPVYRPQVSAPAPVYRPQVSAPAPVFRPQFTAPVSRPSFSAPRVSTPHFGGGGGVHFGGGHRR
jgi:hypothetical protein